ncbi:Winged helix-turn-helix DNA-binding domain [Lasallia pustulata]|uniref:Winged helix-turn-helix DNA-binding domain n=1 Tax=Lasallia pustulata TaxID=136370 RepID=A0A1W5D7D8_9LECA|nr:Winged helix-turn-helix DNA-binding domain [Lasallia pustulata]
MASTRHRPPLQIFQDPVTSFDHYDIPPQNPYNLPRPFSSPLQAAFNHTPQNDLVFNPPLSASSGQSPLKPPRYSSSPPRALLGDKMNIALPRPPGAVFGTDSPSKKRVSKFYPIAPQPPQRALFTTFPSSQPMDKENFNPVYQTDNFAEFPDPSYGYKAPLKHILLEAAPLQDRQYKKPRLEEPAMVHIPEPHDMPHVEDDGTKPPYSYAVLIGMSILRAPNRRLTLAQIYKWISDTFVHYRSLDTGWQNSIRHNLSLNKAFIKQERPKDDPGKGNYWAIEPGMEAQFIKEKPGRRPVSSSGSNIKTLPQALSESSFETAVAPPKPIISEEPRVSDTAEPSSDATIAASDPKPQDDETEGVTRMPPPSSRAPESSPPQPMHSSPPVVFHAHEGTTPPTSQMPSSSGRSQARKRKLAAFNDSGYFSSIESSATRPYSFGNPTTYESDVDRPKIKRGRAEEEIARIRSLSHDLSPSKGRVSMKLSTPHLASSSPLRHYDSSLMLPPLTPAASFKMPPKPPASISPNTNLRNHRNKIRELVGSPVKSLNLLHEEIPFSPAFNITEDEPYAFHDDSFTSNFSIFSENPENGNIASVFGSPEKRSTRRPLLDRASTAANVLTEVTHSSNPNGRAITPALKAAFLDSPLRQKSPSKSPTYDGNIVKFFKDDFFGLDYFADEDADDFGGLDILQGFQKIGEKDKENVSAKRVMARPPLGERSFTSRF